jgi:hypothetical protein
MSHLEFIFNVKDIKGRVRLLRLEGVGYLPPASLQLPPEQQLKHFRGEFRAYRAYIGDAFSFINLAAAGTINGQLRLLAFDEGDTGTGTGQQT